LAIEIEGNRNAQHHAKHAREADDFRSIFDFAMSAGSRMAIVEISGKNPGATNAPLQGKGS
jgi:hypothetical protein